jgi:predicted P-loop ATPase
LIRDVVLLVSQDNRFDSAIAWLNPLPWDGISRVENFFHRYLGVEDTPYTRAVSRYLWTAIAGRVMQPGVKADMVPILVGEQGVGKSRAVAALSPSPEFFAEISLHEKDDNLSRMMRGRLIAEIGELRGLHTKELESIKAFITRTHENWIPKYREFAIQFPRRLIFIGTTNKDEFLADETGNRRWLPVRVQATDTQAIERDRDLLWAEARELFQLLGVDYRAAEQMSALAHAEHTIADSWGETVGKWLQEPDPLTGDKPQDCKYLRVQEVLTKALGFEDRQIARREEMRLGAVLRALGFRRTKVRDGKSLFWAFVPTPDQPS